MRIRRLNESIDKSRLKRELTQEVDMLMDKRVVNLKQYEYRLQEAIERLFPDKCWWEVTDCNIFMDLFENRDPYGTASRIVDSLKIGLTESMRRKNEDYEIKSDWTYKDMLEDLIDAEIISPSEVIRAIVKHYSEEEVKILLQKMLGKDFDDYVEDYDKMVVDY